MLHDYLGTGISHALQGISARAAWAPSYEQVEHPSVPLWPSQKSPGMPWEALPEISTGSKKKKGAAGRFSSRQASSNTCKVCAHAAPHDWQRWLGVWECVALKRKKKCWHHFFAADARRPKGVPPVFVVFRNKDTQLLSLPVFSRRRPAEETLGLVSVVGDHTHCDDQIAELHEIKYKYLVFVLSTDTFICTSLDNFSFWRLLTSTSYICTQVSVLHTPYIGNKTCIAFVFKKDPSVLSKKYVP